MPKSLLLILLVASVCFAGNTREFVSPNKLVKAIVRNFNEGGTIVESQISFVHSRGEVVFKKSFASTDGEHGFGIIQAEWTSDSRYFVFCMRNSGGHQPWHVPTSVYSVTDNRIFSIDELFGPVRAGSFRILSSDSLETSILNPGNDSSKTIFIQLSGLSTNRK
jgi:hypothetical protein